MSKYTEGTSGVDVKQLVQNIVDQYDFEPEIATIVELVANALDAEASQIQIEFKKDDEILEITDNGLGMDKRQFREYHDFAATTKGRGEGIGFAGQGAKLALGFCREVITETWSSNYRGYSKWKLARNKAPYKIHDGGVLRLDNTGTKVTLHLKEASTKFYTEERIKDALSEHYFPLIDCELKVRYKVLLLYKDGIKILLNGSEMSIEPSILDEEEIEDSEPMQIKVDGQPEAKGIMGKAQNTDNLLPGVMICTYGKVIERTYFKKEPKEKEKIIGWIEAPYLIRAVTTDKGRFKKGNKDWKNFFKEAEKEFSNWLEKTGLMEKPVRIEPGDINLEEEINSILKNLPGFTFFGSRTQRDVAIPDTSGEKREMGEGIQEVPGTIGGETTGGGVSVHPGEEPGEASTTEPGEGITATPKPRTVRGGIRIAEDDRPDLDKEAWFDGETVTLNKSHPAYKKAEVSKVLNYHILKAVVLSLIEFNLEKEPEPSYQRVLELQQQFFKVWGEQ